MPTTVDLTVSQALTYEGGMFDGSQEEAILRPLLYHNADEGVPMDLDVARMRSRQPRQNSQPFNPPYDATTVMAREMFKGIAILQDDQRSKHSL